MNEQEALAKARALSDDLGWGWTEPVGVGVQMRDGKPIIRVFTNCQKRGGNTWFDFDQETGELLRKALCPY